MRRMTRTRWKKMHRRAMKKGIAKTVKYLREQIEKRIDEAIAAAPYDTERSS